MGAKQKAPVDDVEADFDQDSRQQRRGDLCRKGACPQQHKQQHHGMGHARPGRLTTGFDVDHRSHRGSGSGKA